MMMKYEIGWHSSDDTVCHVASIDGDERDDLFDVQLYDPDVPEGDTNARQKSLDALQKLVDDANGALLKQALEGVTERARMLNDEDHRTALSALGDAAYYRLGTEAANADEIEEDDDRELFLAYRELEARLDATPQDIQLRIDEIARRIGSDLLRWASLTDDEGAPIAAIEELDEFAEILQNSSIPVACEQIRDGMLDGNDR
jgi:hypothetical protein